MSWFGRWWRGSEKTEAMSAETQVLIALQTRSPLSFESLKQWTKIDGDTLRLLLPRMVEAGQLRTTAGGEGYGMLKFYWPVYR